MLLMFKGFGCSECPFVAFEVSPQCVSSEIRPQTGATYFVCNLSQRVLADGEKLPILKPNTRGGSRPEGCPFGMYPGSIEVQAEESA